MELTKYCCPNCFINEHLKKYIVDNYDCRGNCSFCKHEDVELISISELGMYIRECIDKAYERYDEGSGAYYEDEEKMYCGPDGSEAVTYSIREILLDNECILDDDVLDSGLIEELFDNLYSAREIQKGAEDIYSDIDSPDWVVKGDLYGSEQTRIYHAWEGFKHIVKHYSRFFYPDDYDIRKDLLEQLEPYLYDFEEDVSSGTIFYRVRAVDDSLKDFDAINPHKDMGPPPAKKSKTNRMSPAGIPYLYLSSDIDTALAECRLKTGDEAIVAEFRSLETLRILDISKNRYFSSDSIFDQDYDHDNQWINDFWRNFVAEVSEPVNDDFADHSYEYTATQIIAEYFRHKHYDGICFQSSVGHGRNFVFFFGPDPDKTEHAYPYPFESSYFYEPLPILPSFTEVFDINLIKAVRVEGFATKTINERKTTE